MPSAESRTQQVQSRPKRKVAILGSSGSIGVNTLEVIAHHADRFQVTGLCVYRNVNLLVEQAWKFRPTLVAIADTLAGRDFNPSNLPPGTRLAIGCAGIREVAADPDCDIVVSAIVGVAGLEGTWAALDAAKTVALANKESLVVGGQLVMDLARRNRSDILPVDSEHSAIFQVLHGRSVEQVRRVVLTASGGPFRGMNKARLESVSPREALCHPTWNMGRKVTVDSATLMNKALEVIEAHWLFDLPAEKIEVVIHPESIVHSFVEFLDGSVLAQLSPPDMRLPIQIALTHPERLDSPANRIDWTRLGTMQFETPDRETFPSLDLGYEVVRTGGTTGAILNAANEVAVNGFLAGEVAFLDIPRICRDVLDHHHFQSTPSLEDLWAADRWARTEVAKWTNRKKATISQ